MTVLDARAGDAEMLAAGVEFWFQPIVSAADGTVVFGAECLLRHRRPDGTVGGPAELLTAARTSGRALEVTLLAIAAAGAHAARLTAAGSDSGYVSVNVPASLLCDPLSRRVLLDAAGRGVAFEVLESEPVDVALLADAVADVRAAGLSVLCDDFGTGFASVELVAAAAFSAVKFARPLVAGLAAPGAFADMVTAQVAWVRSLGMATVAEGVEDAGMADAVAAAGFGAAQGWFYGRPAPAS